MLTTTLEARFAAAWFSRLAMLCVCFPLFFFGLGERDLWSSHEARAAQNAQGILDGGDWKLPRLYDGRVEMQKPPLYYWAAACAGWLAGGEITPFLVRLPAALAGLLAVLAVMEMLRRRGRPLAGFLAALILATMLRHTWISRVARIDIPLSCTVSLALLTFYLGWLAREKANRWASRGWWLLGYLAMAAALLLKGPIGVILVAVGAGTFLLWERRHIGAVLGSAMWGIPLILALVGPWFWLANDATQGEFAHEFLWRHNLQRGLGGDDQLDSHVHPWWYYLLRMWVDLFPWSLLLPWAAWRCWRSRLWRGDRDALFGGLWFLSMLLFLSLMKYKRPEYLLPAYPGLAIVLGTLLSPRPGTPGRGVGGEGPGAEPTLHGPRWLLPGILTVVLAMAGGWMAYSAWIVPRLEPAREMRTFAEAVRKHVPQPAIVILFRIDSHALAFHLGKPVELLWQWENLDIWACQPVAVYVIMPQEWAAQWKRYLEAGLLYPVLSSTEVNPAGQGEKLVLFRTQPP